MRSRPDPLLRLVESFFRDYLQRVRGVSPHTTAAYGDTVRLFFAFLGEACDRDVADLGVEHLTVERVLAFLDHLESSRKNSPATRNLRLTALRGFFRHLLREDPARAGQYQRVLSLPSKKTRAPTISYLEPEEVRPAKNSLGQNLRGKSVLVIDDEIHITELMFDVLSRHGARIDIASSGAEALEQLKKKNYDVILCDQRMPGISGQRLYRLIESLNPELQHRFLFVTGDVVNAQTKRFFTQAGVQFIRKPFKIQDLLEAIENIFNRSQLQGS